MIITIRRFKIKLTSVFLFLFSILLVGCASKPSKFYILNSLAGAGSAQHKNIKIRSHIGLKKIQLANYLKQSQIVVRKTNHELILDEFNRWAGPLQENIQQTIRTNILQLLPSATVTNYPWRASKKMNVILNISIEKFEANYHGQSILQASYEISNAKDKIIYAVRNKKFISHVNPENYNSIVSGMNRDLNRLSRNIAGRVKRALRDHK